MTTYCIPDSITPRSIKPGVVTVETIEAIMADGPCAILPVAGDCLEGVEVVDGGWVAVDFTRRPAPPRYKSKGGDGSSDLCLCYATFPGAPGRCARPGGLYLRRVYSPAAGTGGCGGPVCGARKFPSDCEFVKKKDRRCSSTRRSKKGGKK